MVVRVFYPNVLLNFAHICAIQPYRADQSKLLPPPNGSCCGGCCVCVFVCVCCVCIDLIAHDVPRNVHLYVCV